jgi:Ca-activated chloride channel family protein
MEREVRVIVLLLLADLWGWLLSGELGAKTRAGNAAFAQGRYEDALKRYTDAQLEAPEEPRLHYNLGTALYQQRQFDKAAEEFQKALPVDHPALAADVRYNLGNARFRQQDLQGAIESYTQALQIRPDHKDAKYNLELARKLLKQNAQPQAQQPQPQPGSGDPQSGGQKPPAQDPPQPQAGQQNQAEAQQRESQEQPAGGAEQAGGKLTKQQAEQILDALAEREQAHRPERPARPPDDDVEIDW